MVSDIQVLGVDDAAALRLIDAINPEFLGARHIAIVINARGLACPMPLLKTKLALRDISAGDSLYLLADDKNSMTDIVAFCTKQGIDYICWTGEGDRLPPYRFILTKS